MTQSAFACLSAFALAASVLGSVHACADPAKDRTDPLRGEIVRILVSSAPGGGFDSYARMIAPRLANVSGGTVIVENMPGAGGLLALNKLYAAPPDGRTLMIVNGTGAALAQILGEPAVRYDLANVGHLGTVSTAPWMWLVTPQFPVASPGDAARRSTPIAWSGTGRVDGPADGAAFTCEALKLGCRIVLGYRGSSDAVLAVGRGEVDAIYLADNSAHRYVSAGNARAIAAMSRQRSPLFPDVPTIFEAAGLDQDAAWLFGFRATLEDLGRILIVPPGMAADRLAYMRSVIARTLAEPSLVAEGARTGRPVAYVDGETTRENVMTVLGRLSPAQRGLVQRVVSKAQ